MDMVTTSVAETNPIKLNPYYIMKKNTKQQTITEIKADIARTEKHTWYCELIVAACVGASLALAFVIAHGMLTTEWTW